MSGEYNTALQALARNVKTLSDQMAQIVSQQDIAQLSNIINNQFSNINTQLASISVTVATLQSYVNTFPVPSFVDQEIPGGAINGINPTFTLANAPTVGTVRLWYGSTAVGFGMLMLQSVHYTIAGQLITILSGYIPNTGDWLRADYRH